MILTSTYDVVFNFVTYDRMVKVIFDVIKKSQTKAMAHYIKSTFLSQKWL